MGPECAAARLKDVIYVFTGLIFAALAFGLTFAVRALFPAVLIVAWGAIVPGLCGAVMGVGSLITGKDLARGSSFESEMGIDDEDLE